MAPLVSVAPASRILTRPPTCLPPTATLHHPTLSQPPRIQGGPFFGLQPGRGQAFWRGGERHISGRAGIELQAAMGGGGGRSNK